MALIGVATVTLAALILVIRSNLLVNKALGVIMWATLVALSVGGFL